MPRYISFTNFILIILSYFCERGVKSVPFLSSPDWHRFLYKIKKRCRHNETARERIGKFYNEDGIRKNINLVRFTESFNLNLKSTKDKTRLVLRLTANKEYKKIKKEHEFELKKIFNIGQKISDLYCYKKIK